MMNYNVKIENFKIRKGRTYTYTTLSQIENKITKNQYEKLLDYGYVNTKIGLLTLEI